MRTSSVRFAIVVGVAVVSGACRGGPSSGSTSAVGSSSAGSASSVSPDASAARPPAASFPIPSSSVGLVLNPQGLPSYDGPTGSVEGTVTISGPPPPDVAVNTTKCPAALDTYGKLFRAGTPATPKGPAPLADAVVVVTGYRGFYIADKDEAVHETIGTNCAYPSRTIAITYGQRLEVSNKSRLLFAPLIDETITPAVMVAPPLENGEPVKVYPTMAGHFILTDRMETFVKEDLYVFRHPLHAVTDRAGHYRIDGVPVGKLEVGTYHPAVEADAKAPVEVTADAVAKVDLSLTYQPKRKVLLDDAGLPPRRLRND